MQQFEKEERMNTMRFKRSLSLVLASIMLAAAALSGCSSKPADNGATASTGSAASQTPTTGEDGRAMEGNTYLEGLPIVKEKETFTLFCDDNGLAEDKIMYPILEEQTNIHVELMLAPNEAAKEKKNILLNSGDYPDVIGGWIFSDNDIMSEGMNEQIYIPLDGLIEKYSPKMQEILDLEGVRQAMTLPDGHIYTIPYAIGEPLVSFNPFINTKWLKTLNLEMPTTPAELKTVLKAFKEKDPNGNGKADEIPFSGDPINLSLGSFAGWWGVDASSSGNNKYFATVDGKLVFGPAQEGYKEMIKYFADLYKEGLIDPEIYTQDKPAWRAKGQKGGAESKGKDELYGVSMAYGGGEFAVKDRDMYPDYDRTHYDPLPVLQADPNIKPIWRRNCYGMTTFRTQAVITDTAKNPAAIIRWWDNVFQLENSVQIQAGLIGKRITKLGEGEYQNIPIDDISKDDQETYGWANMFTQSMPKFIPKDFKVKDIVPVYEEGKIRDALYEPFLNEAMPVAWVDEASADRLKVLETDILNYMKKTEAAWVTGQADIESGWDAHLKQLDALGLQELTKIRQDAIDKLK